MLRDVEVRPAGAKGLGVFARRAFDEGELVFRRRHALVTDGAGVQQLSDDDRMHVCQLGVDRFGLVAPPGAYLNHSCDPSAMRHGVVVFAWRPIAAGDEITLDYRVNALGGDSWPCACGAPTCTGTVVGDFFAMDPDRQELLLPHAPAFIRRAHAARARQR